VDIVFENIVTADDCQRIFVAAAARNRIRQPWARAPLPVPTRPIAAPTRAVLPHWHPLPRQDLRLRFRREQPSAIVASLFAYAPGVEPLCPSPKVSARTQRGMPRSAFLVGPPRKEAPPDPGTVGRPRAHPRPRPSPRAPPVKESSSPRVGNLTEMPLDEPRHSTWRWGRDKGVERERERERESE
jgi:hypothetical protein